MTTCAFCGNTTNGENYCSTACIAAEETRQRYEQDRWARRGAADARDVRDVRVDDELTAAMTGPWATAGGDNVTKLTGARYNRTFRPAGPEAPMWGMQRREYRARVGGSPAPLGAWARPE